MYIAITTATCVYYPRRIPLYSPRVSRRTRTPENHRRSSARRLRHHITPCRKAQIRPGAETGQSDEFPLAPPPVRFRCSNDRRWDEGRYNNNIKVGAPVVSACTKIEFNHLKPNTYTYTILQGVPGKRK